MKEILASQTSELPEQYILFPDNAEDALKRLNSKDLQEALHEQRLTIKQPHNIVRITYKSDGKSMLAVELKSL